jgi:DNA-binding response OmpR family regulator
MKPTAAVGNVIIADDDRMIRSVLQAKLEALDLNVFVAADGMEAVGLASRIPAVLIILDLKMPKLNGLLACERIREMPCNAQTPIAILTSTQEKTAEVAGLKAGATAFFTKPFRAPLLLHELARFLPISDAVRVAVRRDAERALEIAQDASKPPDPYEGRESNQADSLLNRGKYILDTLRG